MVSWVELLFTVTAASYLLGRKELPKLGRFVGLYSGRSVGAIIRAKNEFFEATKDSEIVHLQREFQKGIQELNEIRSELTSVGTMSRPHQPVGAASAVAQSATVAAASAPASTTSAASSPRISPAAASVPPSTGAASLVRPSVDVAMLSGRDEKRGAIESLALAELKLAERGAFASRIESLEGGADYVAASIVDSLLLDRVDKTKTKSVKREKGESEW